MSKSTVVQCSVCGHKNRLPAAATGSPKCGHCGAQLPWVAEAGDEDFDEVVDKSTLPVIVDLWAPWCGPCRAVTPALEKLAARDPRQARLVELRFFGGLTTDEAAVVLDVAAITVKRDWAMARTWLYRELGGAS